MKDEKLDLILAALYLIMVNEREGFAYREESNPDYANSRYIYETWTAVIDEIAALLP